MAKEYKFKPSDHYDNDALMACGHGELFGPGNAQLPLPPMLMFDKITHVNKDSGVFKKGCIIAELNLNPDLWFFGCHFEGDPVMPGCLGVDAVWQLLGFYLAWLGHPGRGRALGSGDIKFKGQITPDKKKVTYTVNISRVVQSKLVLGVADAEIACDDEVVYFIKNAKVGLFI